MSGVDAERFASKWIADWNARDVDAVLSHFADEVQFTSPLAQQTIGSAIIEGKAALRAYWQEALRRRTTMHFTLDRVLWDPERRELGILFIREVDGERRRACELLQFDNAGLVVRGEALHGAAIGER
jgi:hypothetical protein